MAHPSTSSRRALLGIAAALPIAALPALVFAADDADRELIAACRVLATAHARLEWFEAHPLRAPFLSPEQLAEEDAVADAGEDWRDAAAVVIALPATTPAGVRAKALATEAALRFWSEEEESSAEPEVQMAWSLVKDLLAAGRG